LKVLLVNNRYKEHTAKMAEKLAKKLEKLNIEVETEDSNIGNDPELIIVLGGDGTILRAARQYAYKNLPVMGVNMGNVGFLSTIEVDELDMCLGQLLCGDYKLDQRMMLNIDIYEENKLVDSLYCINELVIRSNSTRMVTLNLAIDGEKSGIYRGDGLIIASPTGSTAYSLSAGGPICDPQLDAFIITPIASHFICKRPTVLSSDLLLELTPVEYQDAIICLDGQVLRELNVHTRIKIKKAEYRLKLVNMKKWSFLYNLENRLKRLEGS
jgi:NAD+ kinase